MNFSNASAAGALAGLSVAVVIAACGGGSAPQSHSQTTQVAAQTPPPAYQGPTLANPAPAPRLILNNYLGTRVNLDDYRGRAVLVTFIYTHCPDVCPLIVANLHNALDRLGQKARKVAVVGVSTDPKGDTRTAIRAFLDERGMLGRMQYLVGSRSALAPVWRAWGIDARNPTATDEVAHTAVVYGITASGRIVTAYPSNFTPAQIAHDVPLLAAQ
jgi:protein SCO1/2